ncbi:acetyl-CoA synthetase-like protein [Caulochytrium protostelioides]|uniref:Acetyl-CoA synthetase-like protein n=1 Tax=Caulochytrium protostelioides TaxID=1555241 RepID=A0A4P9WSJ4_9FUNG|nr:acetyl-CoA synthetase-like protein [Caulochytrium protostelioides]
MLMFLPDGQYDGYVGAPELTQRKLVIDVMEPGDQWWTSGDLLACDARGFYTFVDRLGDTFRWKGENVATCEVQAACMAAAPAHVAEVNVYGVAVPHASGKAGMAAVLLRPAAPVDAALAALAAGVQTQLPAYARPLFLRLRNEPNATTATLKFQKQPCVRAGFDPAAVGDDHVYYWSRDASAYVALTPAVYTAIQAGTLRF